MNPRKKPRSQIDLMREILKVLSNSEELSIRQISLKANSSYRSTLPALKFLKFCKVVRERTGVTGERKSRLFRLA